MAEQQPEAASGAVDTDFFKQDKITFATRAPQSADKGFFWVQYAKGSATKTFYIRHPITGAWGSGVSF